MWEASFSSSFHLHRANRGGLSRHVSRQIFLVLYRHCLRTKKRRSTEAQPVRRGILCEAFAMRGLKRYFNRRSTKQQWQVHPGDTFQPRGLTPTPLTRRTSSIFSPCSLWFGEVSTVKEPKHSKQKSVREFQIVFTRILTSRPI